MSALGLPALLEAHEPPEAQGRERDSVRLLVADQACGTIAHARFADLPRLPRSGRPRRRQHVGHARRGPAGDPERRPEARAPALDAGRGEGSRAVLDRRAALRRCARSARSRPASASCSPAAHAAEILAPYAGVRLWLARLDLPGRCAAYLDEHGSPIRYGYVPRPWPLSAYQNVYAVEPGSAEMPSAGRPFTTELITRLVAGGVLVAPIVLHTGVSSQERHERPYPERYRVPEETARLVNAVHAWGGRVIATGTTVVRALETVARP